MCNNCEIEWCNAQGEETCQNNFRLNLREAERDLETARGLYGENSRQWDEAYQAKQAARFNAGRAFHNMPAAWQGLQENPFSKEE